MTPTQLYTALNATVTSGMWSSVTSITSVSQVNIIPLDGTSSTSSFTTGLTANWTGGSTGTPIPQVAAIIKLSTGVRGRDNRGRVYLPQTSETADQGGVLGTTVQSNLQTAWSAFLSAIQVATPHAFVLGVAAYDRRHSGAGAHFTPCSAATAELYTATQRRRQPGRKVSRH